MKEIKDDSANRVGKHLSTVFVVLLGALFFYGYLWPLVWRGRHCEAGMPGRLVWFAPFQPSPARSPGLAAGALFICLARRVAHAMQLEGCVDRVACRRGDVQVAAERTHLAGEPIK